MKGWETKKLGEVCDLIARGVAPKYLETGGARVVNQKCVRDHAINFDLARRHDHTAKAVPKDRYIRAGDVLVNSTGTGTLGRVAQVRQEPDEPTTVDTHVTIVRPQAKRFFPDFFGYILIKIEDEIAASGEGASGQTELARSTLTEKFLVSFPTSLDEQRRIVAILDEAFAGLAVMRQHAEANLKNARAIFDSHLNSIFSQRVEGWVTEGLNEHVRFVDYRGKTPPKRDAGIRLITAKNVKMGFIRREPEEFIDPAAYDEWMTRGFPKKGDVLFTTEAPLGNVAQLDTDEKVVIGQRLITMQPVPNVLDRKFLAFMLMSGPLQEAIHAKATGATVLGIKAKLLKFIPISYPQKLAEQRAIADKIEEISLEVARLESLYRQKLVAIDELKQSILHRCFLGALSAKDALAA